MQAHTKKWMYRVAAVVIIILLAYFADRTFNSYRALMEKVVYGKADIHSIRGWMNVERLSRLYDADPACVCGQFNLTVDECGRKSMWELNNGRGRRTPPGDRHFADMMTPVYEKITYCMLEKPKPDDWMSMRYMSMIYGVDAGCICEKMGVGFDDCTNTSVGDIVRQAGPAQDPGAVKDAVWAAVQECNKTQGGQ